MNRNQRENDVVKFNHFFQDGVYSRIVSLKIIIHIEGKRIQIRHQSINIWTQSNVEQYEREEPIAVIASDNKLLQQTRIKSKISFRLVEYSEEWIKKQNESLNEKWMGHKLSKITSSVMPIANYSELEIWRNSRKWGTSRTGHKFRIWKVLEFSTLLQQERNDRLQSIDKFEVILKTFHFLNENLTIFWRLTFKKIWKKLWI